jgi:uncharacterized membrane protein (DUF4010 family)
VQQRFGSAGVLAASALASAVDQRAAAAGLSQMAAGSGLSLIEAGWGLMLLLLVAGITKSVLAFFSGGSAYGWRIATGLLASSVAMALALWLRSHTG